MVKKKLTIQEQMEYNLWCELYEYVKQNILGYHRDMKLSKQTVLRLQGLRNGQFMSNKNQKPMASYDYKSILLTFKFKKHEITSALERIEFNSEQHKINYIFSIIENSINDIVLRLMSTEKQKEKDENLVIDSLESEGVEYQVQEDVEIDSKLEDLW